MGRGKRRPPKADERVPSPVPRPGTPPPPPSRVSRAFDKLDAALESFSIDVAGHDAADLGCHVGGFTECLLERGAGHVVAVDTGRNILAWRLRSDPRVEAREGTNALHADPPEGGVQFVAIDLGWTPQRLALPAARRWVREGGDVVSLVKPNYEIPRADRERLDRGRLPDEDAHRVLDDLLPTLPELGFELAGRIESPIRGGKSGRGRGGAGNLEFLLHLRPRPLAHPASEGP
ncbi:MAG: SAM-dependent methyltransferase [Phycisphaerales bacterium]